MSLVKRTETIQTPDGPAVRRVEERTCRIDITTPLHASGPAAYKAVVYREWVEYLNDVPVKITALPPLAFPITPGYYGVMARIAQAVDATAKLATDRDQIWPRDGAGELMTPP